MKTSLDIPDADLDALLDVTGAKTKRDAILIAVRDYTSRARRAALNNALKGSFGDGFITQDELLELRRKG